MSGETFARSSALSPAEIFRLDLACKPIREAFGWSVYLVGSVSTRRDPRDIDVRLILPDEEFDALAPTPEVHGLLNVVFAGYLRAATGLPIDFAVQRMTQANEEHEGVRNPMGGRKISAFIGDAPAPAAARPADPDRGEVGK